MRDGRFDWLERPGDDFPYYDGRPTAISGGQWCLVMLGVAAGLALLLLPPPFLRGALARFAPAILFSAIPLGILAWVAGRDWTAVFRRLRGMDFVLMFLFAVLNWLVTLAVGFLIVNLFETMPNPAGAELVAAGTGASRVGFFARTGIQLFGEEVFTILPFLALLHWFTAGRGVSRRSAIVLAWLATAVMFALAHLHTYDWHLPQALLGVGAARLVLTLPYLMTKNLWVSTGAHVLNDWTIFVLPLLVGGSQS